MSKVSIIHCPNYDRIAINRAIREHFKNLGQLESSISKGDKVLIKPNLICPKPAAQPAQTHPAVICETARILIEAGAKVTVADSPAWSNTLNCLKALDIDKELLEMGVRITDLDEPVGVTLPFVSLKTCISRKALEADKIINLPKLKAHQQMGATIAVKNMFGAVPGKRKALWHYRQGESPATFAAMLLGVYELLRPTINIVDAVVAMEGQGPINGTPKYIGLLLASTDAVACEAVCAKVLGLDEDALPVVKAAMKLYPDCGDLKNIEIIGEDYRDYICRDFKHAIQTSLKFSLPRICRSVFRQVMIIVRQ